MLPFCATNCIMMLCNRQSTSKCISVGSQTAPAFKEFQLPCSKIVTAHHPDIALQGCPACKITSPIRVGMICIRKEVLSFERPFFICCMFCICVD
uniref:Alpha-mannosidase n=1 Tax=Rhizophora mucronata TaxID=61149 RepID=A0A2P2MM17_RHIMU